MTRATLKDAIQSLTQCTDFELEQVMDRIDLYTKSVLAANRNVEEDKMSELIEGAINQQPFEDWFARIQKTPLNEGVLAEVALAAYRLGYQQGIAPVVAPIVMGSADQQAASDLYHELLYAVGRKYDGETRHQTALRYIRQAEQTASDAACETERAATKDGIAP